MSVVRENSCHTISDSCQALVKVCEYMEECRNNKGPLRVEHPTSSNVHVCALLTACEMLVQRGYQLVSVLDNPVITQKINRILRDASLSSSSWVRFAPLPPEAHRELFALSHEVAVAAEGWAFEERGPALIAEVPHPSDRIAFTCVHARKDLGGSEHLWVYYEHKVAGPCDSTKVRATSVSIENTRTLAHEILTAEQEDDEPRPHRVMFLTAKGVTASAAEPLKEIGIEVETWKFLELIRNPSRHILWTHVVVLTNDWDEDINSDLRKGLFRPGRGPVDPMTRLRIDPLDLPVIRTTDKVTRFYGLLEGAVVCRIAIPGFSQGFFQLRRVPVPCVDEHRVFLRDRMRLRQATCAAAEERPPLLTP
jgi:hypothetical protein